MQKLFGKKALLDNLDSNNIVEVKLINQDKNIISKLNSKNIKYSIVDKSFFKEFEKELNHQGIITYIKSNSKYSSLEEFLSVEHKKSLILIVDSIEDPYNFGAILRTSDAMGVDAVIYKKDNQVQINDYVIKSSMGAINNINLFKVTNLATCLEKIKASGYWVYSSALSTNSVSYNSLDYDDKTVLVVGNENKGISKIVLDNSDFIVNIPMHGKVQSLNVSVATGILLSRIKNK